MAHTHTERERVRAPEKKMEPRGDCMSELPYHHGSEFLTGLSALHLPLATQDDSSLGVTKALVTNWAVSAGLRHFHVFSYLLQIVPVQWKRSSS